VSVKERKRRERKAFERGREARLRGERYDSNPLRLAAWSVGIEWDRGWKIEDEEIMRARLAKRAEAKELVKYW
jgi:hypothetical protein